MYSLFPGSYFSVNCNAWYRLPVKFLTEYDEQLEQLHTYTHDSDAQFTLKCWDVGTHRKCVDKCCVNNTFNLCFR